MSDLLDTADIARLLEITREHCTDRVTKRRAGLALEAIWMAWPDYRLLATHPSMFGHRWRGL